MTIEFDPTQRRIASIKAQIKELSEDQDFDLEDRIALVEEIISYAEEIFDDLYADTPMTEEEEAELVWQSHAYNTGGHNDQLDQTEEEKDEHLAN
jgi:hypothetical protein